MEENIQRLIQSTAELACAQTMKALGITAGEISQTEGKRVYGKWFTDAVKQGRLFPTRVEEGRAGTRWFSITQILALKATESEKAVVIFKQ